MAPITPGGFEGQVHTDLVERQHSPAAPEKPERGSFRDRIALPGRGKRAHRTTLHLCCRLQGAGRGHARTVAAAGIRCQSPSIGGELPC